MDTHTATDKATATAERLARLITADSLEKDLARARVLAHWLDAKFELGGVKFGLQGIVGVLPVGGDAIATIAGLYPMVVAYRHKLGGEVVARMAANLGVGFFMGLLPWVGDYADVWWKPNLRNLAVLERAAAGRST